MVERVAFKMEMATNAKEICGAALVEFAKIVEREVVERMKAGADYGNVKSEAGEVIGHWNIFFDGEESGEI